MTDIPADIAKTARAIGESWFGVGHHDSYALAAGIEAALMAERERCAKIAHMTKPDFVARTSFFEGYTEACDDVASAILSPERAGE